MRGRKYGDNPGYILEELRRQCPNLDFVWLEGDDFDVNTPSWCRRVLYRITPKTVYELSTARVIIDSHRFRSTIRKRKGQLFIETWHGGLGMKKIEMDTEIVRRSKVQMSELKNTCKLADVFISNSDHLSNIYRRAFGYKGPIWKCGYPKDDIMVQNHSHLVENVRKELNVSPEKKILLYAPTYRNEIAFGDEKDFSVYDIDYERVKLAIQERFGGEWVILVKWHPTMVPYIKHNNIYYDGVTDVTNYNDMQGLLCTTDILISDYSSCLFDAALRGIPCFTYAKDFDKYKETQGTYFEMEELPFPYAKDNDELIKNIRNFDKNNYIQRWNLFKKETGLIVNGHSAKDIAGKINEYIKKKCVDWD